MAAINLLFVSRPARDHYLSRCKGKGDNSGTVCLQDAFVIAKQAIDQAPKLIPILGHRYIPDSPQESGNPIFSVYQTDIICYGRDLEEYLGNEFGYYFFGQGRYQITKPVRSIAFWSYLVDLNNGAVDDGVA